MPPTSAANSPFASVTSVPSVVKDFDVFRALAKAVQRLAEIHRPRLSNPSNSHPM